MRNNRRVVLGLMAVSTTLIASIGMSVAWYANGAYLRVSNVDVSLMGEPNLGMSLTNSENAEDYHFGEFPYDELPKMKSGFSEQYETGEDVETIENGFVPVSSMFSDDWIGKTDSNGNFMEPQFCRDYKRASIYEENTYRKTKTALSGYFSVPLYLYCDNDMYASVDSEGTNFKPNIADNEKAAQELALRKKDKTKEEYLEDLNRVVNSLRFSILDCETNTYWIIDPNKGETTTYLCGALDLDASKEYDYYYDEENDTYKEYFFGEYDSSGLVYNEGYVEKEIEKFNAFEAKHAMGVQSVDMDSMIANNLVKVEDSITPEQASKIDMISLKNHVPHRIVLSIYIEGWDRDNTAVSALGAFYSSIKFKLTVPNFSF